MTAVAAHAGSDDLAGRMARGAAWMVFFKIIDRSVGLATTIILARLLLPGDFGLVAMAMAVIAALELLSAFSFDVTLIQNPSAPRAHFDTAWTFNVLMGLLSGMVLVAIADPSARFFGEPRLAAVMYVLATGTVLQGFENIGTVAFRRELRFDREFKYLLGKRLSSVLVTIPLAVWLGSYWALVFGQLAGKVLSLALSFYVSDFRPRLSLAARGALFHFSKWMLATHAIVFLHSRIADFMIAKLAGATALGIYTVSYETSNLPTTELVAPINRAAFPAYSRVADDLDRLRESFLGVISMVALFAVPAGIGIVLVADLIVPVALGWHWQEAVPLIQVLGLCGVIIAVQSNVSYVYLAVGRPGVITGITAIQFIILIALLVPAVSRYSAIGAAWAFLGTTVLMLPVNQVLIARQLRISPTQFATRIGRPVIACVAMAAAVMALKSALHPDPATGPYLVALLSCVATGAVVYVAAIYALWRLVGRPVGPELHTLEQLKRSWRSLHAR